VEYISYININTCGEKETKWEQFSKFLQTTYGHISSIDDAVDRIRDLKVGNNILTFNTIFHRLI